MPSDLDVVRDLHQVVDLGATPDGCRPERSSIHGDVGAKFNIVVRKNAAGGMEVSRLPIPEMPDELKRVVEEMK